MINLLVPNIDILFKITRRVKLISHYVSIPHGGAYDMNVT